MKFISMKDSFTPFLEVSAAAVITKNVIIHYKLKRVRELVKIFLKNVKSSEGNNFKVFSGRYKNEDITFIWKPPSAPTMAITLDELSYLGVKRVIYLGTFGALQRNIRQGEIFLVSGAVRREGCSEAYVEPIYPAVPDFMLTHELAKTAEKLKIPFKSGIVLTEETYHAVVDLLEDKPRFRFHEYWPKKNVFGVEMECSALFVAGSVRKVSTASVLVCNREFDVVMKRVSGKPLTLEEWRYGRDKVSDSIKEAAKIVVETFTRI